MKTMTSPNPDDPGVENHRLLQPDAPKPVLANAKEGDAPPETALNSRRQTPAEGYHGGPPELRFEPEARLRCGPTVGVRCPPPARFRFGSPSGVPTESRPGLRSSRSRLPRIRLSDLRFPRNGRLEALYGVWDGVRLRSEGGRSSGRNPHDRSRSTSEIHEPDASDRKDRSAQINRLLCLLWRPPETRGWILLELRNDRKST